MAGRAVITVALGADAAAQTLALGRSLKLIGDQTHRIVYTDVPDQPWAQCFHEVIVGRSEKELSGPLSGDALFRKVSVDELLILEPRTLAFKRLAAIFEYCRGKEACAGGGSLLYVEKVGVPLEKYHQVPDHFQFIEGTVGKFKSVEVDVESNTCRLVLAEPRIRLVEPYLWRPFSHDALFNREAKKLERLARIERTTKRGFIPFTLRTRRSFDKRILKLRGKI